MPQRKYHLGAGDLILNSPFAEPGRYWSYDRKYRIFTQMDGRRPAAGGIRGGVARCAGG